MEIDEHVPYPNRASNASSDRQFLLTDALDSVLVH